MLITNKKQAGVSIGEYGCNSGTGEGDTPGDTNPILGWIEPACDNPAWILWFSANGEGILYTERSYENGSTGAVQGEPIRLKPQSHKHKLPPNA